MRFYVGLVAAVALLMLPNVSSAVDLYTENFEIDQTGNWMMNTATGADPTDSTADVFFDYSTVGVPPSPGSSVGNTRALNLQTNVNNSGLPSFQGMSASPIGQDFSSNPSYKLTFDWWSNLPMNNESDATTALGSTQLSTFGIGTNGTAAQWPGGTQNSLYYAASTDGGSSADWRIYSPSDAGKFSYQEPNATNVPPIPDGKFAYASAAGTGTYRNNSNTYYATATQLAPAMPPAEQIALFPQQAGCPTCTPPGTITTTPAGTPAFKWRAVEIAKNNDIVTWKVDGLLLSTLDLNDEVNNDFITLSGGNIFFGQSDINAGASNDANRRSLLFTLIDNIKVATIEATLNTPDFNGNGIVDAADYTVWRNNLGLMGTGTQATGDANGDLNVDSTDYDLWKTAFGTMPGSGASIGAVGVPEPSGLLLIVSGALSLALGKRRR